MKDTTRAVKNRITMIFNSRELEMIESMVSNYYAEVEDDDDDEKVALGILNKVRDRI